MSYITYVKRKADARSVFLRATQSLLLVFKLPHCLNFSLTENQTDNQSQLSVSQLINAKKRVDILAILNKVIYICLQLHIAYKGKEP